ncbi:aminotransferase class III-fold pyridoxal phosphate-dependent enzyme [Spirillospora sp. NPDC050679]
MTARRIGSDIVLDRALGAHVWDDRGARYTDLSSSSGAAPLGAGHPPVVERVVAELRRHGGILPESLSRARLETAERLLGLFPWAGAAEFFRTGSCATTAAVRIARVHTGARTVLTSGYHGWHDWQLQYRPELALPDRDPDTFDFGYDLDEARRLAAGRPGIAAVIITPEVNFFPPEHLRAVRAFASEHGALLIVDEVMTGFRFAPGGFHTAAGVVPDLVALSKGLANGTALSAVVGSAEVMAAAGRTHMSNTYQREQTPFSAALATLDLLADGTVLKRIEAVGELLMAGLDELFAATGTHAWAGTNPAMFDVVFADAAQGERFFTALVGRGYLHSYGQRFLPSSALTDEDAERFLRASAETLREIRAPGPDRPAVLPVPVAQDFAAAYFAATPRAVADWAVGHPALDCRGADD